MAKSHLIAGDHRDRGTDRRLECLDPDRVSCDRTRCREDLAHHAPLAKCHDLEQPSGFRRPRPTTCYAPTGRVLARTNPGALLPQPKQGQRAGIPVALRLETATDS